MSGTAGAEPIADAYFGFYLLAMGTGRPRTAEELAALLATAGFSRVRAGRRRAGRCSRASRGPARDGCGKVSNKLDNLDRQGILTLREG